MFKNTTFSLILLFLIVSCNNETKPPYNSKRDDIPVLAAQEKVPLPNINLQYGDQGNDVRHLQTHLVKLAYPLEVTGFFDEHTIWALTDIQLQFEDVHTTGLYDIKTRHIITKLINNNLQIEPGKHLAKPNYNSKANMDEIIANPYDVLALINKQHALPSDYIPNDLVIPNVRFPFTEDLPKKQLRKIAAEALEEMFEAADAKDLNLFAQSGYRSFNRQEAIFAANVKQHGEVVANSVSARAGESEHQSGLTMDVTSPEVGYALTPEFGQTKEGKWIKEHASEFGFIIRYPKRKEHLTTYQYEPWHLRYVGKKAAKVIVEKKITLEEYFGVK